MNEQRQALFFRQLGAALQSGVGLGQAVRMAAQAQPRRQREQWQGVILNLERGQSLPEAFQSVRGQFAGWAIAVVEIAAMSGALAQVCREVADSLVEMGERQRLWRGMVFRSLGLIWSLVMVVYMLLGGAVTQGSFWWTGLLTAIALGGCLLMVVSWQPLQQGCRRLPPLKSLFHLQSLIYLGYLQLPLDCGLSVGAAVHWWRSQFPDLELQRIFSKVEPQIRRGTSLTQAITPYFPAIVVQMIKTGETSGTLPQSFAQIRQYYQRELSRKIAILRVQILLLSLLSFGLFVALLGADVIQTMLQRYQDLSN